FGIYIAADAKLCCGPGKHHHKGPSGQTLGLRNAEIKILVSRTTRITAPRADVHGALSAPPLSPHQSLPRRADPVPALARFSKRSEATQGQKVRLLRGY